MKRLPYSKENVSKAVSESTTYADAIRKMGRKAVGGNHATIRKYIKLYGIDTSHFDSFMSGVRRGGIVKQPLRKILIKNSTYSRTHLKDRLYKEGLKNRKCEMCGQGEEWMGKKMSLILDHINGINDDNRIENLRIVCPNCNSTLETHCARNKMKSITQENNCHYCKQAFMPNRKEQKYCSGNCYNEARRLAG